MRRSEIEKESERVRRRGVYFFFQSKEKKKWKVARIVTIMCIEKNDTPKLEDSDKVRFCDH